MPLYHETVVVERNHYFPIADVDRSHLEDCPTHTVCPWKGTASYFWRGVKVVEGCVPAPHSQLAQRPGTAKWCGSMVKP